MSEQVAGIPGGGEPMSLPTDQEFLPLDPFPAAADAIGPRRLAQITWALLALGLAIRVLRYLLRFPLWPDEAFLAHSFLDRDYLDLLRPLDFEQVAPLLYLWVQLSFVKLLGFSEYPLRLFPLLCGVGSLFVFRHLAGRLLRGTALVLAVGIFAVAYPLVRYAAEAKPYPSDMFASLLLLALAVEWWRNPGQRRWWWALLVAMPVAVLLSYPAAFVGGGISMTMALVLLWRGRKRGLAPSNAPGLQDAVGPRSVPVPVFGWRDWLRWAAVTAALCGGFALLFAFSAQNQMDSAGTAMRDCWNHTFPPLDSPGELAKFLLVSHTSDALAYPLGGANGASALTALCCGIAVVLLVRARQFALVGFCLFPLVLNFVAAAMHSYPYAGHVRFALYMAPMICLLAGLGAARGLKAVAGLHCSRHTDHASMVPGAGQFGTWSVPTTMYITLAVLAAIGLGAGLRDLASPYKETCWMRQRDFARWFWVDKALDGELVCLRTDCGLSFYAPWEGDALASVYYCNQRIYSPRHARQEPPPDAPSPGRPLRCVRFRPAATKPEQEEAFRVWLGDMQSRYRLAATERHPQPFVFKERQIFCVDYVEVYDFVLRMPRTEAAK